MGATIEKIMTTDLARNLQLLCARERSVSALCREVGLNRQQFARYLSGESQPSSHNLWKIADHFGLQPSDLQLPHKQFHALHQEAASVQRVSGAPLICRTLDSPVESLEQIKSLSGYYFSYLQTPADPSRLLKSLVHFFVDGDRFMSRWEESFMRAEDGSLQVSSYEGVIRILNGYLFIVDIETSVRDTILETVLRLPYRRRTDLLTGVTMGMTTGRHRLAFASITAFKFLGKRIDWESKRRQCGFHDMSSRSVDRVVRSVFAQQDVSHVFPKVLKNL